MRARKAVIPPTAIRETAEADWMRASVRMAAERSDVGPELRAFVREMVRSW